MLTLNRAGFALVLLLPVLMTLLYGGAHQPVLASFYISVAIIVVVWAVEALAGGELKISRSYLQLPLLGVALYGLVQTISFGTKVDPSGLGEIPRRISADPFATWMAVLQFFALAIFFAFALTHISTAKRLRRLAALLTIFGFAYAFFAVLQSVISPDAIFGIYKPQAGQPFGTFVNRNDFAALIVLLSSLPLGMLFSGTVTKDKRLLYLVAVAMMGTSILLSQSRGGALAFVCELVLLIMFTTRTRGSKDLALKLGLSLVLVAAVGAGAVFVGGETSLGRLTEQDVAFESQTETTNRAHIWGVTMRMIGDNMPMGIGLGAYPAVYPHYDTGSGSQRVEQAHNDYLQLVSDAGVVGAVLGVWFLVLVYRQARQSLSGPDPLRRSLAAGALAGVSAVLLHSLFDFVLHITAVALMFLLVTSVLVACGKLYDDDVDDGAGRSRTRRTTRRQSASVRKAVSAATTLLRARHTPPQ